MLIRPLETEFSILYGHSAFFLQRVVRPDHSSDKALLWGGVSFWKTGDSGGNFEGREDAGYF
jgi:hypothetical protein